VVCLRADNLLLAACSFSDIKILVLYDVASGSACN